MHVCAGRRAERSIYICRYIPVSWFSKTKGVTFGILVFPPSEEAKRRRSRGGDHESMRVREELLAEAPILRQRANAERCSGTTWLLPRSCFFEVSSKAGPGNVDIPLAPTWLLSSRLPPILFPALLLTIFCASEAPENQRGLRVSANERDGLAG